MSVNVEMYERNLPPYLAHDLEAWKKGVEDNTRGTRRCFAEAWISQI